MAKDALAMLGISLEEAREVDQALLERSKKGPRDRRVCICGHAMNKHSNYVGIVECKPTAMRCPCKKPRPVLEVEDTRLFLRKTEGAGAMHALARGMYASLSAGREVTWIVDLQCDKCGSTDKQVTPVPVTQSGYSSDEATGFDVLLCHDCRTAS